MYASPVCSGPIVGSHIAFGFNNKFDFNTINENDCVNGKTRIRVKIGRTAAAPKPKPKPKPNQTEKLINLFTQVTVCTIYKTSNPCINHIFSQCACGLS